MLRIANGGTLLIVLALLVGALTTSGTASYFLWAVTAGLLVFIVYDLFQNQHSLGRVFPFSWRGRLVAEELRPEAQQYFVETNTSGKPASRKDRDWCYASSKGQATDVYFGTEKEYHQPGQIHIRHKGVGTNRKAPIELRPILVGAHRPQPFFLHGRYGVSDISFGAAFERAKQAIASGAADAGVIISIGEGGLTPYDLNGVELPPHIARRAAWHLQHDLLSTVYSPWKNLPYPESRFLGGPDLMIEIGSGKFGFRKEDGSFDFERFAAIMRYSRCKCVKLKLHQGAKAGGGGHLPGRKVNKLIAKIRRIPVGQDCISPNTWDEFDNVPELMAFGEKLTAICGKPWGIKIAIGDDSFIIEIAKWMAEHPGQGPDFIHVDGGEGGTGAGPLMLADYVGMSILHALPLVDNVLRKYGVRNRVVLMSSGKVFNPGQLFIQLALGADFVFGIRGTMFALGCIQAKICGTNRCPSGVTTNHWWLKRALVPRVKWKRVSRYLKEMNWVFLPELLRVVRVRDSLELDRRNLGIVTGFTETPMSEELPYPEEPFERILPIAENYGMVAPSGPDGPTRMDKEMRAVFADFFDDDGKLEYSEEVPDPYDFLNAPTPAQLAQRKVEAKAKAESQTKADAERKPNAEAK